MATLRDIAPAHRMAVVAQATGLGRKSLYKSLSADGSPWGPRRSCQSDTGVTFG